MSMVFASVSVSASRKCTLCAVFAVTIRLGPPGRLLRSSIYWPLPRRGAAQLHGHSLGRSLKRLQCRDLEADLERGRTGSLAPAATMAAPIAQSVKTQSVPP